jgi:flagella basal body P-ring formation protein FlgA
MMPLASMALAGALAGCLALGGDSDRVLARDLAPLFPALARVAGDTPLAPAPIPGAQRVFRAAELRRIAARLGVEPAPEEDICVERKTTPPDPARMLEAMRRGLPAARIEIQEFSRQPVPQGDMEFPLAGLRKTPAGGFWRGYVRYAGGRRFATWARVAVSVSPPRVMAAGELKAGRAIEAAALRVETGAIFPEPGDYALSIEEVAGKMARRPIPRGTAIRREWLSAPPEVARGDAVRVEVRAGAARLEFEARADASGGIGDTVPVRNPFSGRRFMARVEAKGKVSVEKGDL